ncbi:MAG: hypothetical protein R3302_08945, partial [Sulfurimonadaceae bacterium]|nr:hypothetical protein [Sulfurimonadaceae bacterium]
LQEWLNTMRQQQEFLFHLLKSDDDPIAFIKLSGVMFVLEMGKLAANYIINETGQPHRFNKADPHSLLEQEQQVIGSTGDELAIILFENWNFEPEFIELFRHSLHAQDAKEHKKLAAMLQLTRTLITIYGLQPLETAQPLISEYGLNSDNVKAAYEYIKENFEHEVLHLECKG